MLAGFDTYGIYLQQQQKTSTLCNREIIKVFFLLTSGHSLTQFVRHCADHFLNSEHKEIRMEAARTCSRLLTPSIHLISGHVVSQTAVQVVADVLSKLLVVGITDPGKRAWKSILRTQFLQEPAVNIQVVAWKYSAL